MIKIFGKDDSDLQNWKPTTDFMNDISSSHGLTQELYKKKKDDDLVNVG